MGSEWPTARLKDLCSKIGSGATPKGGSSVYLDEGKYALIRSQNVRNDAFDYNGLAFIEEHHAEKLSNVAVENHDVLLNITGDSVARCCQVDPDVLPARVNQHVSIVRPDPETLDPLFLRYYFVSPVMQNEMLSLAGVGATRNALTKGMIEGFEIPLPPLPEQKAIAHILGTLDDKIELNRRMNATLEGMAQALFKSWFVDFDPVIDNALAAGNPIPDELAARAEVRKKALESNQTSLSAEASAKAGFPAAFEHSDELGPVPVGWRVGKAKDFCSKVQNGGTPNRSENSFWEGGTIPWLASGEVRQPIIIETGQHITDRGFESSSAKWNPRWTTVVALYGATAGQTSLLSKELTTNQAVCALIPKEDCRFYNYLNFRNRTSELEDKAVGSAQQNLSKGLVESVSQLDPGTELLAAFDSAALPMFEKRISNLVQSQSLAKLRNTLLPKLLSGELEVLEAGETLEACKIR